MISQQCPRVLQGLQKYQCLGEQDLACRRELGRVRTAVHQICSGPSFEGLDAPGKRRLGDVAQLSRTTETAGFSQAHKVFKPLGFHGRAFLSEAS